MINEITNHSFNQQRHNLLVFLLTVVEIGSDEMCNWRVFIKPSSFYIYHNFCFFLFQHLNRRKISTFFRTVFIFCFYKNRVCTKNVIKNELISHFICLFNMFLCFFDTLLIKIKSSKNKSNTRDKKNHSSAFISLIIVIARLDFHFTSHHAFHFF